MIKSLFAALAVLGAIALAPFDADAQGLTPGCSNPAPAYGVVWTAGQWTTCFSSLQPYLGYAPVNRAGDTMQGKLTTFASATSASGFNLPQGEAPASPNNGDMWMTSSGLFLRVAGVTVGPTVSASISNTWTGTQDFGSATITVPTQTITDSSSKAASTSFVQSLIATFATANAVEAATITTLPNSPTYNNGTSGVGATLTAGSNAALTLDGYSVLVGDRVLVKDQSTQAQNGVYIATQAGDGSHPYILTRASNFNSTSNITNAGAVPVINGSTLGLTQWLQTGVVSSVGSSNITFSEVSGGGGGSCGSGSVACLNTAQAWTAGQRSVPVSVSLSGSTFTPDMNTGNNFSVALVHGTCAPCQIANPANLTAGQTGVLVVKQSATGSDTVSWGGNFAFTSGTAPTLQTAASAEDYLSYYVESGSRIVIGTASSVFAAMQTVNFNASSSLPTWPTGSGFAVNGADSTATRMAVSGFATPSFFTSMRADGTAASPSAVQSGDQIGGYNAYAYNGSSYVGPLASFRTYAAENQSSGHGGTKGCIATTPTSSTTLADSLCQQASGGITIGNPSDPGAGKISTQNGALVNGIAPVIPQGRLTLVSGSAVMTSDQTAKSQIFYDCYQGKLVPYYDGTSDAIDSISSCELSLTMQTSGTGVTNNAGVFDIWWVHSGANRVCVATDGSGGGWASDTGGSNTARGTGYSQVHNTRGYWTNVNAITHCYNGTTDYGSISADQATYLGTIFTTAAGKTGVQFRAASAAGGSNAFVALFNAYNRVRVWARSQDSTGTWAVTSSTWAPLDVGATGSGLNNRISFVDGLAQSTIQTRAQNLYVTTSAATSAAIGLLLNATSGTPTTFGRGNTNNVANVLAVASVEDDFPPVIGLGFIQAMQANTGNTGTSTFAGNGDQQLNISVEY